MLDRKRGGGGRLTGNDLMRGVEEGRGRGRGGRQDDLTDRRMDWRRVDKLIAIWCTGVQTGGYGGVNGLAGREQWDLPECKQAGMVGFSG